MKCTPVILLILIAMTALSCKTMKDEKDNSDSLDFEVVQNDYLMGGGAENIEESIVLCNSEQDLQNIKEKMNSVNYATEALDNTDINFEKETVIGYFQPVRSSGGYALQVQSLNRVNEGQNDGYILHLELQKPQGAATMALTQPFVFIKTKKIDGLIKYKVNE
ncbi:MAG: protease complex subunit PrcB family protein [bacterium]|nr:protease complex subunit PrcB family protein [bacterium]